MRVRSLPSYLLVNASHCAVFAAIKDHVLLPRATKLRDEDERMAHALTPEVIDGILALVPDAWLIGAPSIDIRGAYRRYLLQRLAAPRAFVEEAARAR